MRLAIILMTSTLLTPGLFAQISTQTLLFDYSLGASFPLGGLPEQLGAADLDGDGLDDVYCSTNFPPELAIFLNDGTGALAPVQTLSLAEAVFGHDTGDFNGDGIVDLVIASVGLFQSRLQIYPGIGDGTFSAPSADVATSITLGPIAVGDLNGDGMLDVVSTYSNVSGVADHGVQIYLGDGTGQLALFDSLATAVPPYEVFTDDVDLDGAADLVISTASFGLTLVPGTIEVRMGLGAGAFGPTVFVQENLFMGPMRLVHLDGDALVDLAVVTQDFTIGFELRTYLGSASGFQPSQALPISFGSGVLAGADADADGDLDLYISQYDFMTGETGAHVAINDGTGALQSTRPLGISGNYSAYSPIPIQLAPGGSPELAFGNGATDTLEIYAEPGVAVEAFIRGDTNADLAVDIADVVALLNVLFVPGTSPLECDQAGDANDDDHLDIADAIAILDRLFVPGSAPLPAPYPDCGSDPTLGSVACDAPPCP
ncbi:MAG: VCBS repeat-containing protein [Planctomycetes bacterium]|nr:VCBS repeat-containing protein [Planctomycetota bacterium]